MRNRSGNGGDPQLIILFPPIADRQVSFMAFRSALSKKAKLEARSDCRVAVRLHR